MNSAPPRLPLNRSLKELLRSVTGWPVEIASPPLNADGSQASFPYVVIYPIVGGGLSGTPFCGVSEDAEWEYQMTCYAERDDQAEFALDKVRDALLGRDQYGIYSHPLDYTPGKVTFRDLVGPAGRLVREGRVYKAEEDYCIKVTTKA